MTALFQKQQLLAYSVLFVLTAIGFFTDKIPIQLNITLHSMLIITIGSYKSLEEMIKQFKRVHIDKKAKSEDIETLGWSDTLQFPVMAGAMLCGLYFAMQYFGNEVVNYLLIAYIALGGTVGVKSLLQSFAGQAFDSFDKDYLVDFSIKFLDLDVQITQLDIFCCIISFI